MISDIHPFPSKWVIVVSLDGPANMKNGVSISVRNENGRSTVLA